MPGNRCARYGKVNNTETVSALLAAWLICTTPGYARFSFSIFTDNQSLVRSLMKHSSGSGHYLVDYFCQVANTMQVPLKINWIAGHSEVQGNKELTN